MIMVAVLLLPGLALLLLLMVRLEDRLLAPGPRPRPARHARRHHLRLIRGGGEVRAEPESRHIRPARPRERKAA
ncbi:hypothetical protein AB0I16_34220 [Streptomyces sp. NPDC050703]|uniref:hypothetical protein n=1 Tax=Streptomyces sp. NPDC050703 TaxID=3157218 RepID=UPI0034496BF0